MRRKLRRSIFPSVLAVSFVLGLAPESQAGSINVVTPKWSQLPEDQAGENVPSDIDWRLLTDPAPNSVIADDFRSDGRPITDVRWWGSYFDPANEPVPEMDPGGNITGYSAAVEEGFILSFHQSLPAPGVPGDLLGTYIAPVANVTITPTDLIGWDQHRVWEYQVELAWTHPEHLIPGLSEPGVFLEEEGVIYWLSIVAQNGHEAAPGTWEFIDNGDPIATEHFWGWHTSPDVFNEEPVMGTLAMPFNPDTNEFDWDYGQWETAPRFHSEFDMAFELLTPVPEPSTLVLVGLGSLVLARMRRTRR